MGNCEELFQEKFTCGNICNTISIRRDMDTLINFFEGEQYSLRKLKHVIDFPFDGVA